MQTIALAKRPIGAPRRNNFRLERIEIPVLGNNDVLIEIEYLLFFISIIVIVGGLTRLTDSGLSITTWDVVKGILPPLNREEWDSMFTLYKQIPQYYLDCINFQLVQWVRGHSNWMYSQKHPLEF